MLVPRRGTVRAARFLAPLMLAPLLLAAAVPGAVAAVSVSTDFNALPGAPSFLSTPLPNADRGNTGFDLGGAHVSFANVPTGQGVVHGSLAGQYAAPVTDAAGDLFASNYFSSALGVITISFAQNERAVALLWGSVDAGNRISLYEGKTLVGSVLGSDVAPGAKGSQGYGGSVYTLINSSLAFDSIALTSNVYSFESALYEVSPTPVDVPEPAAFLLFGAAAAGLAAVRRRT